LAHILRLDLELPGYLRSPRSRNAEGAPALQPDPRMTITTSANDVQAKASLPPTRIFSPDPNTWTIWQENRMWAGDRELVYFPSWRPNAPPAPAPNAAPPAPPALAPAAPPTAPPTTAPVFAFPLVVTAAPVAPPRAPPATSPVPPPTLFPIAAPAAPPSALPTADLTLLSSATAFVVRSPLHRPITISTFFCMGTHLFDRRGIYGED
jgi:hypothetical protein